MFWLINNIRHWLLETEKSFFVMVREWVVVLEGPTSWSNSQGAPFVSCETLLWFSGGLHFCRLVFSVERGFEECHNALRRRVRIWLFQLFKRLKNFEEHPFPVLGYSGQLTKKVFQIPGLRNMWWHFYAVHTDLCCCARLLSYLISDLCFAWRKLVRISHHGPLRDIDVSLKSPSFTEHLEASNIDTDTVLCTTSAC